MSTILDARDQEQVSHQLGMPVNDISMSQSIQTTPSETVQLYYNNSGTRTIDAGQAAGTVVDGQLAFGNILNSTGSTTATFNDTSLSYTCAALTSEVRFPYHIWETMKDDTWANKVTAIGATLASGEFCVDYLHGYIVAKKASAATSMTSVTYKINQAQTGGSSTLPSAVDLTKVGGTAITTAAALADNTANPTAPKFGAFGMVYDGSTWDMQRGDATNGTLVNLGSNNDVIAAGNVAHDAADSGNPIKVGGRARTSQLDATANNDRTDAAFNEHGEQVIAGYNWSNGKIGTEETDPISSHHLEETLAAVTDGADDTYYYYVDMDGYTGHNLHTEVSGGSGTCTLTIEGSWQDDGTAQASCTYQDITQYGYEDVLDGTGNASYTADAVLAKKANINPKYIRVKIVAATGAADDADWTIYSKKWY